VAERLEPSAEVMGADAGLHTDQAGRWVGKPDFELPAQQLPAQDDGAAPVEANERVLADVDAEDGNGVSGLVMHGGAPYRYSPPSNLGYCGSTAGPFH
jgi:hypothetical protein